MQLKIFKQALYIISGILGIHSYAAAQDAPTAQKQKELEEKMKAMEVKMQVMQAKMDSMKANQRKTITINGVQTYSSKRTPNQVFTFSTPPTAPLTPLAPMTSGSFSATGSGGTITCTGSLSSVIINKSFAESDKKLQERIKSGEVKEKIRTYSKSYSVNAGDKLQISNSYGKVVVTTWNKNEFKVEVEIKGLANDEDDAQHIVDGVTIADSKDGSVVSFNTKIESNGNKWEIWNSNGKSYIHRTSVSYKVYMPSKNALEITNRYGSTVLPDFDGKLLINTSYGDGFWAKALSNPDNDINIRYADVNIESMTGGNLSCQYGNLVKIGTANNITLDTRYVSADITKVKTAGNFTVHYGNGLKIGDIDKSTKNLNINSAYSGVLIGLKKDNNFDFDVTVRYNNFTFNNDVVKVTSKNPDDERRFSTSKTYKGYVGKSTNDTKVTITSAYQGVQFQ